MNLLETLVLASYFYTTAVWVWLERRLEKLRGNEIAHLQLTGQIDQRGKIVIVGKRENEGFDNRRA